MNDFFAMANHHANTAQPVAQAVEIKPMSLDELAKLQADAEVKKADNDIDKNLLREFFDTWCKMHEIAKKGRPSKEAKEVAQKLVELRDVIKARGG